MTDISLQQQVVEVVRQSRQAERDAALCLNPAEREMQGTKETWTFKDGLVHINAWKVVLAENLADGRAGREADTVPNFQAFNDSMFERFRTASWDDVNAYADEVVATLIAEIEQHDDTQLQQPDFYPWIRNGDTITSQILGSCFAHTFQHLGEFYLKRGEAERAISLYAIVIPAYQTLSPTPRAVGTASYNQACLYAQMGRGDLALPLITAAFAQRPDLIEWSRKDTDLDLIRDELQTLYT